MFSTSKTIFMSHLFEYLTSQIERSHSSVDNFLFLVFCKFTK